MKGPNKDDEELSALLEGQVQGPRREELLAHLSTNDDDYAVFADTASVLRAMEEEDARAAAGQDPRAAEAAPEGVIPLRRPARGPWMPRRSLAIAASIATIALVGTLTLRTGAYRGAQPVRLAKDLNGGLPGDWTSNPPWSSERGQENESVRVDAVRAGALLVQLAVAAQAHDSAATHELATRLTRYEDGREGTALQRIANNPDAAPDSLTELIDRATGDLARALERKPLELGAWVEAARIAAHRSDPEFFGHRATAVMLRRAERMASGKPKAGAAVDGVRMALPDNAHPHWDSLKANLAVLLAELAS